MPYKRKTTLDLNQLRKLIQKKRMGREEDLLVPIGIGILLNEIEIIFLSGDEKAEDDIISLLNYSVGARSAYHCLLKRRKHLKKSSLILLEQFEKNPDNTEKISYVKELRRIARI